MEALQREMGRITRDLTVVEGLMQKWAELRHLQWVPRRALQVRYIAMEMPKLEEVLPNFDGYMTKITQLLVMALVGGKDKSWKRHKSDVLSPKKQEGAKEEEVTDELKLLKMRQAEEERLRQDQDSKLAVVFALLEKKSTQVALDVAINRNSNVIALWKRELVSQGLKAEEADKFLDPILESLRENAAQGSVPNEEELTASETDVSLQVGDPGSSSHGLQRNISAASLNDADAKTPGSKETISILCIDRRDGGKHPTPRTLK